MNRFRSHTKKQLSCLWHLFSILFTAFFFIFFFRGVQTIDTSTSAEQMKSLERAIRRSVVQCYAVEGTYPPNLDYLKEHYGICYDSSLFYVDYTSIGSNIMPDITIIPIEESN